MPSYTVTVATGSQWFAGTDDYVYVSLQGTAGCSERHLLDKPFYNDFERGSVSARPRAACGRARPAQPSRSRCCAAGRTPGSGAGRRCTRGARSSQPGLGSSVLLPSRRLLLAAFSLRCAPRFPSGKRLLQTCRSDRSFGSVWDLSFDQLQ